MSELLLVDGNNLAIRLLMSQAVMVGDGGKPKYDLWRYLMFTNIVGHTTPETSRIVVAIDGKNGSWRKIAFPAYKANRKAKRDSDDFDWDIFFREYSALIYNFSATLPIKFIDIPRVEGDDVIGTITFHEKSFNKIKIVTADSDFKQLIRDTTELIVDVFDPIKGEYMECDDVRKWLIEQILTGQAKDNIYNIITPSDWETNPEYSGKRKPGFGPVKAAKVIESGFENWVRENGYEKNFIRNRLLVDLSQIPDPIVEMILNEYSFPAANYSMVDINNMFNVYGWDSLHPVYGSIENAEIHKLLSRLQ